EAPLYQGRLLRLRTAAAKGPPGIRISSLWHPEGQTSPREPVGTETAEERAPVHGGRACTRCRSRNGSARPSLLDRRRLHPAREQQNQSRRTHDSCVDSGRENGEQPTRQYQDLGLSV